ncbi:MAG: beta-galactosidase small subunit, partial [Antricoccus sp.]
CVFRAPVDNDGFKLMPDLHRRLVVGGPALERWQDASVDRLPAEAFVGHEHRARTDTDGSVIHHHIVTVPEGHPDLARVGVVVELSGGFDQVRWYGRGPLENYPDRNRGAMLGVWQAGVDRSPYLVPQEFGLRTDCRWFEFIDPRGRTVRLDALEGDVLHVSATDHTDDDLFGAAHETELRPRRALVVHVDVVHRGLGTASCGPDVLDRYRILPGEYRFGYRLSVR